MDNRDDIILGGMCLWCGIGCWCVCVCASFKGVVKCYSYYGWFVCDREGCVLLC